MITTFVWFKSWAYHSPHPRKVCWHEATHRSQRTQIDCVYCDKPVTKRGWYYPCGTSNPPAENIGRLHEHCATALILSGTKWGRFDVGKGETIEQHGTEER